MSESITKLNPQSVAKTTPTVNFKLDDNAMMKRRHNSKVHAVMQGDEPV